MTVGGFSPLMGMLSALVSVMVTPASVEYGPGGTGRSRATAQVVSSIISYTRWPTKPDLLRVCVVGPASYADNIAGLGPISGMAVEVVQVPAARASASDCTVIYAGALALPQQRELMDGARGRQILTIAEADPGCRSQAMVCLVYEERGLTFELNIDAVSRSGLRVDPRILRLARETS